MLMCWTNCSILFIIKHIIMIVSPFYCIRFLFIAKVVHARYQNTYIFHPNHHLSTPYDTIHPINTNFFTSLSRLLSLVVINKRACPVFSNMISDHHTLVPYMSCFLFLFTIILQYITEEYYVFLSEKYLSMMDIVLEISQSY